MAQESGKASGSSQRPQQKPTGQGAPKKNKWNKYFNRPSGNPGPIRRFELYRDFAYFEYEDDAFERLSLLCKPEDWDSGDLDVRGGSHLMLRAFVENTFSKLWADDRGPDKGRYIEVAPGGKYAAFNTGLVDANSKDIYALFEPMPKDGKEAGRKQPWLFKDFCSDNVLFGGSDPVSPFGILKANFDPLPPRANYFKSVRDAVFDYRRPIKIGAVHIINERLIRFPLSYLIKKFENSPNDLKILESLKKVDPYSQEYADGIDKLRKNPVFASIQWDLEVAVAETRKMASDNYTVAVPLVYTGGKGHGAMGFGLPLYLEGPSDTPSVVLVVSPDRSDPDHLYAASTVYTPMMAYCNARVIAKPMVHWLSAMTQELRGEGRPAESKRGEAHPEPAPAPKPAPAPAPQPAPAPKPEETAYLTGRGVDMTIKDGDTIGCRRNSGRPYPDHSLGMSGNGEAEDVGYVSQIHGTFSRSGGFWFFTDSSSNGTKVLRSTKSGTSDEIALKKGGKIELKDGDKLLLACFEPLTFHVDEGREAMGGGATPVLVVEQESKSTPKVEPEPPADPKPRLVGPGGLSWPISDRTTIGVNRNQPEKELPNILLDVTDGAYKYVSQFHGDFRIVDGVWMYVNHSKNGTVAKFGGKTVGLDKKGDAIDLRDGMLLSFAFSPDFRFELSRETEE